MIEKLFNWLRKKLFGLGRQFFRLDTDTYLQVKGGEASILAEDEVPRRYRDEDDDDDDEDALPKMGLIDSEQRLRSTRIAQLRKTDPYKVAKHAKRNEYVRYDVLQNPELVNADSRFEAELKLAIAKGEDIQPIIDSNPKVSESDVEGMLETDFMVKWGYTLYGDDLAEKINEGEPSEAETDVDADVSAEVVSDAGGDGEAETGDTGSETGEGLAGKAAGSIDTGTGDVDISTEAAADTGTNSGESATPGTGAETGGTSSIGGDVGGDIGGDAAGGDVGGGEL